MEVLNTQAGLKTQVNTNTLSNVDRLGFMLADKTALDNQVEVLKDEIKNQGEGKHSGQYYKASVTLSQRPYVNYEAVLQDLDALVKFKEALAAAGIDLQKDIIDKHTKTSASLACRVTSL